MRIKSQRRCFKISCVPFDRSRRNRLEFIERRGHGMTRVSNFLERWVWNVVCGVEQETVGGLAGGLGHVAVFGWLIEF